MKRFVTFLAVSLLTVSAICQTQSEMKALQAAVEADLVDNLLPFWTQTVDPNGGFYGVVTTANQPVPNADKGAILNARILWTFARAYRYNPLEEYKGMADRAAAYFIAHFIDPEYGGVFWSVDAEGHPKDMTKQTYAASFGIYGLAEHFRATGDARSLEAAQAIYRTLEKNVHDKARLGYRETFLRDYTTGSLKGVDGQEGATKTMNTHIHLLEAYTTLYQVWPDAGLRANLQELIGILQMRLYSPETKHLLLFCDNDWHTIGHVDSYGHDIETSWLLTEAAEALGDEQLLNDIRKQSVEMVDVALQEGMTAEGVMLYEKADGVLSRKLSWWPQCEAVVGCINAWQITGKKKYFDAAVRTWNYIDKHFVDHAGVGWFMILGNDATPAKEPKVSAWNCPYHNSRMGFELATRLRWPSVHTEVMAWSNITGVRMEGELVDFESSLRIGNLGGKMEVTARERQNHLSYKREGATQTTITPMHGAKITQQVTDVDRQTVQLNWHVEALEDLKETAFFCLDFAPKNYASATVSASGKKISVKADRRRIEITLSRAAKMFVREENGHKQVYVTLLPELKKGAESTLSAVMKVGCTPDHEAVTIHMKANEPGRVFAGFGGNFRIQNVEKDPMVIDYCLSHMRVAFGRVEFPWARWDKEGAQAGHIRRSAEMARKLKAQGMPVIVSCWFPPEWAGVKTTRSDGSSVAYALRPEQKERTFESMAGYLLFLKRDYGVEADYFSFNESDLGIDVVFTPEEHRDFIKEFGQYMADKGLKTLMLLGDNSDANTFDFIIPTLNDPSAHKYVGAISFHSWRGCDDETLQKWAAASRQINVPLIVGEGSTDAAAHRYPWIFNETTFALYEINLYTRLCAICQPLSILQWQLTSDYSLLWGGGIYGSEGPMRPTQRFFNIKQLSMTPADAFAVPAEVSKDNVNVAAFVKPANGESCVHIVNNAASCKAHLTGLPACAKRAVVYVTNQYQHAEASLYEVHDGCLDVDMPAESFVSIIVAPDPLFGQNKYLGPVRTPLTEKLLSTLKETSAQGKFLFGHHDATLYGIGWVGEPDRSDVQSVCGDYPALLGFDLERLRLERPDYTDGAEAEQLRREIIKHYERGGVVSLSWHSHNPLSGRHAWVADSLLNIESQTVPAILAEGETHDKFITWLDRTADFLNSLKTADGVKIPVIFRPWHEHTGSWFWWGQANCTTDQFIALWRLTVERLQQQGVSNALYAYSTGLEAGGDPVKFMERYPGDEYIDLLGLDFYCSSPISPEDACAKYVQKVEKHVPMLCQLAQEHNKVAAITETGYEGIKTADWWTQVLLPSIAQYPVSYVMVWRNAHDLQGHFYAPYPGHPSAPDFVNFYQDDRTLFVKDLR